MPYAAAPLLLVKKMILTPTDPLPAIVFFISCATA